MHQLFVLPGQAAEQEGGLVALIGGEGLAQSACGSDEVLCAECRLLFPAGRVLPLPVGVLTLPTRKSAPVRHRWPDEWKCSFLHLFFKELPNDRDIPRCHPRNPRQQYALLTSLSNKKESFVLNGCNSGSNGSQKRLGALAILLIFQILTRS